MKHSVLLSLVNRLSPKEQKAFRLFLASPYHNTNARLIPLWDALLNLDLSTDRQELDLDYLHKALFNTSQPFHKQKVYDHCSFLLRKMEDFLALQAFESDEQMRRMYLMKKMVEKNHESGFHRASKKLHRLREKAGRRDMEVHHMQYEEHRLEDLLFLRQARRDFDQSLDGVMLELDAYYLAAKLRYACSMLNRQNIIQADYALPFLPEVLHMVESRKDLAALPAIALYRCIYLSLTQPDHPAYFPQLLELLEVHGKAFPREERIALYGYAQNYCTKKINQGQSAYLRDYFNLDKQMLAKDLLLSHGLLDHRKYKNMVTVGLRLKEYAWVEAFLEQYARHLPEAFQEIAYLYCRSAYLHAVGDFSGAKGLLWRVDSEDIYYQLGVRALLLKIYFQEGDEEGLESQARAFKGFLSRNKKISPYQLKSHRGLIKYTLQLSRLRGQQPALSLQTFQFSLQRIAEDLAANPRISNLNWLKEQVKMLGEGKG
ncbi:MAG: hypothetical protein AAFR61_19720 [Bacteroidota bacterium]